MTKQQFYKAHHDSHDFATTKAAKLVLVDGVGTNEAARRLGVGKASVSRMVSKIREAHNSNK